MHLKLTQYQTLPPQQADRLPPSPASAERPYWPVQLPLLLTQPSVYPELKDIHSKVLNNKSELTILILIERVIQLKLAFTDSHKANETT